MLVSGLAPKEGTSLFGLDGVPTSGWINPLLSIKLENKKGEGAKGEESGWRKRRADAQQLNQIVSGQFLQLNQLCPQNRNPPDTQTSPW